MSLVSYENSSGSEDESIDRATFKLNGNLRNTSTSNNITTSTSIFTTLPTPITHTEVIEEENDEFLQKKESVPEVPKKLKQPIKIGIPSLSQFDSDDDEPEKKKKPQAKASGLFAVLPPPKTTLVTTKHFVPNVVKRNMKNVNKSKKKIEKVQAKKKLKGNETDDSEDDDEMKNIPDNFDDEMWLKVCGRQKRVIKPIIEETPTNQYIELAPDAVKPYNGLDNQAFKELMGSSSKRKGDNIEIVDINEDEILPDKEVWMTKSLTDPELAPKYVAEDPVNDTCRRKHHITYLAQQAKENEQDLKNQWAANRFTRQKTQAKYGF